MRVASLKALVRQSLSQVADAANALKHARERAVTVASYVSSHREGDSVEEPGVAPASSSYLVELTIRQREIFTLLSGKISKVITFDTGISWRTVENYRACIMRGTGSSSLQELAGLAFDSLRVRLSALAKKRRTVNYY